MLTRRHFLNLSAALFSAPIGTTAFGQNLPEGVEGRAPRSDPDMWPVWDAQVTPAGYQPSTSNPWGLDDRFLPRSDVQICDHRGNLLMVFRPGGHDQ